MTINWKEIQGYLGVLKATVDALASAEPEVGVIYRRRPCPRYAPPITPPKRRYSMIRVDSDTSVHLPDGSWVESSAWDAAMQQWVLLLVHLADDPTGVEDVHATMRDSGVGPEPVNPLVGSPRRL